MVQAADGSGSPQRLSTPEQSALDVDFSPGGRFLVASAAKRRRVFLVPLQPGSPARAMTAGGPDLEREPRLSPDGKWLAYTIHHGHDNVFIAPVGTAGGGMHQVSDGIGFDPLWAPDS